MHRSLIKSVINSVKELTLSRRILNSINTLFYRLALLSITQQQCGNNIIINNIKILTRTDNRMFLHLNENLGIMQITKKKNKFNYNDKCKYLKSTHPCAVKLCP